MALNDVAVSDVFGSNSGFYAGNSIPVGILNSSKKFLIIEVEGAVTKANLQGIGFFGVPITEVQFNTATDALFLINAGAYSYTVLNSKGSPISSLRKFDLTYRGWATDNNQFESNKAFKVSVFDLNLYQELSGITDLYNPSSNSLT